MVFLALGIGFLGVAAMGVLHHVALTAMGRLTPSPDERPTVAIQGTFLLLLLLHLGEILGFSLLNALLLTREAFAQSDPGALDLADTIYLTGINFTTLGYTRIELMGDIRLVTMMQALGGFMFLTWSATYLYSVCESSWKKADREG